MARKNIKKPISGAKAKNRAQIRASQNSGSIQPSSPAGRKLARSSKNRVLLGVMGGIAEYFNADPMHVRIIWAAFIIVAGLAAGAVAYALIPTVLTILAVAYLVAYLLMSEPPVK